MRHVHTFEGFLTEQHHKEFAAFMSVDTKRVMYESFWVSPYLTAEEKIVINAVYESGQWESLFLGQRLNEESIVDKIKAKAAAAMQVIKDKGKEYLSKAQEAVLKIGGSIMNVIKKIVDVVGAFLKKAWEYCKSQVEQNYGDSKEEIIENLKKKAKEKTKEIKEEITNLGSMLKAGGNWISGLAGEMAGAFTKAAKTDESLSILEHCLLMAAASLVREDKKFVEYLREEDHSDNRITLPYVSSLMHKVAEFPPFKLLHKIEKGASELANRGLEKLSAFLTRVASAPGPFDFEHLGNSFGLMVGAKIKIGIKSLASTGIAAVILGLVPGLGVILGTMLIIAKGIWFASVAEEVLNISAGTASAIEDTISGKKEE